MTSPVNEVWLGIVWDQYDVVTGYFDWCDTTANSSIGDLYEETWLWEAYECEAEDNQGEIHAACSSEHRSIGVPFMQSARRDWYDVSIKTLLAKENCEGESW